MGEFQAYLAVRELRVRGDVRMPPPESTKVIVATAIFVSFSRPRGFVRSFV